MLSLIWTVLFVHIAIYLVNTIGASTIDNLVCSCSSIPGGVVHCPSIINSVNRQTDRSSLFSSSYGFST